MSSTKSGIIGIVGGMGPEAGLTLFNCILSNTGARTDQEHLPVILISFPGDIVDRTLFLQNATSINPAHSVIGIVRKLERAGAQVVGIACNTCHSPEIYDVIVSELDKLNSQVKLVNMPFETCEYIKDSCKDVRRIGLMTTNGTYISGVYKNLLLAWGYDVVIPDFKFQDGVIHKMIYDPRFGIKSSPNNITEKVKSLLDEALRFFKQKKSDAIILGCTELSSVLKEKTTNGMLVIDSTDILAKALIREAIDYNAHPGDNLPAPERRFSSGSQKLRADNP